MLESGMLESGMLESGMLERVGARPPARAAALSSGSLFPKTL